MDTKLEFKVEVEGSEDMMVRKSEKGGIVDDR